MNQIQPVGRFGGDAANANARRQRAAGAVAVLITDVDVGKIQLQVVNDAGKQVFAKQGRTADQVIFLIQVLDRLPFKGPQQPLVLVLIELAFVVHDRPGYNVHVFDVNDNRLRP